MPTYIRIAEPKVLPQQRLMLGIPLAIWALSLLLILAVAANHLFTSTSSDLAGDMHTAAIAARK